MARSFIPYGQLANGNYGVLLDPATQFPLAAAAEILTTLPSVASVDNYNGRLVFQTSNSTLYVYGTFPVAGWKPLQGIPATVGNVAGNPPVSPVPQSGSLYWDLDTEVLFVWDGTSWQAAGGRYAASIIENSYVANGITTNFATGASGPVPPEYAEVFLDGVRQRAGTDYSIIGTLISFLVAPPAGLNIYVRTLVSDSIVHNAQPFSSTTVATGGQTDFPTGLAGSNPASVFVFVDGLLQSGGGADYSLVQQDTTITAFTKPTPTTGRAVCAAPHGIPIGASITLNGFNQPEYNGTTYVVTSTPSATDFVVTVQPTDPVTGTGSPTMFFSPPYQNDVVVFTTPRLLGEVVEIRTLKNVVVTGSVGEENTLASAGAGISLAAAKIGTTLQVKSLTQGPNIILTDLGGSVEIAANVGTGYEDRVGINAFSYAVTGTTSYVGVRNTSSPVTISLIGIAQETGNSGRRIIIKDESRGASANPIQIVATPALIEGSSAPYVINTNGGSVCLVMDGNDWYVVASYP